MESLEHRLLGFFILSVSGAGGLGWALTFRKCAFLPRSQVRTMLLAQGTSLAIKIRCSDSACFKYLFPVVLETRQ